MKGYGKGGEMSTGKQKSWKGGSGVKPKAGKKTLKKVHGQTKTA